MKQEPGQRIKREDGTYFEILENPTSQSTTPENERVTSFWMSTYEMARIISIRALQLSQRSPPLIDLTGLEVDGEQVVDPLKVAELELIRGVIPWQLRRYLPGGGFEDWDIRELQLQLNRLE
eukprot:TRINITY_DN17942_c0_g1_i1.p2 TRINITY_DN17942_c0_g1~~TRINITY_DN17942_c0_g1_i1.p2  ORF type:complete len:142 (+),score=13.20 TRINITY_DN17942_c0_g1_i1:62-427(+)